MTNKDIKNIQMLMENSDPQWVVNIVEGELPQGNHIANYHGYKMTIGEYIAKLDNGIRGNMNVNARVEGDKVFLSYIK